MNSTTLTYFSSVQFSRFEHVLIQTHKTDNYWLQSQDWILNPGIPFQD